MNDEGRLAAAPDEESAASVPAEPADGARKTTQTTSGRLELGSAALHGLPGHTVACLDAVTEADPAAVLITLLTGFGAAAGPAPFCLADGSRHGPRVFAVIVGKTARARKGTSWRVARAVLREADPGFFRNRVLGGFGSGEALVEAVGGVADDEDDDAAEPADVRALVLEEEFARILRVSERDGSTLSPIIRAAWDDGDLHIRTRKRPVRARGAHVVVLAHVTRDELLSRMRSVEVANGLANRHLFIWSERSKRLPGGGGLDADETRRLGAEWRRALEFARTTPGPIPRSSEAEELWRGFYFGLDDDRPGMLGALTARAEAHVLRLSLVYALADRSRVVDVAHLHAALDVWAYAERSVFRIFGDAIGDPVADLILRRLRERGSAGMSRTEIRDALGRHEREVTIQVALDALENRDLARMEKRPTGGRPTETWYPTSVGDKSDRTRPKGSSVAYVASVAGKVGEREPAWAEAPPTAGEGAGAVASQPLCSPSNNHYKTDEGDTGSIGALRELACEAEEPPR